jgi:hypothetical protein
VSDAFGAVERAFAAACARERIQARVARAAGRVTFEFAGQENAQPAQLLHHFELELRAAGVQPAQLLAAEPAALDGLARAVARMRTLLIEHNSFLEAGVPYVFAARDPVQRDAGLGLYRFPKAAAVALTWRPGAFRIAFAPGPLGEVTSSGFYLLARAAGDFTAEVRYGLELWQPGPDCACLGLFAQDARSTTRYYSQILSVAAPPRTWALASLEGAEGARVPVAGRTGWLRLGRRGTRMVAAHRDDGDPRWVPLGDRDAASGEPLHVGCKIWSKQSCGGLVAELTELRVGGRFVR